MLLSKLYYIDIFAKVFSFLLDYALKKRAETYIVKMP